MSLDILERVKEIMEAHRGKQNQISAGKIGEILDLRQEDTHVEARSLIRQTIEKYNMPIIAGGKGYYLATSQKEVDDYVERLDNRISEINKRKKLIIKAYKEY